MRYFLLSFSTGCSGMSHMWINLLSSIAVAIIKVPLLAVSKSPRQCVECRLTLKPTIHVQPGNYWSEG